MNPQSLAREDEGGEGEKIKLLFLRGKARNESLWRRFLFLWRATQDFSSESFFSHPPLKTIVFCATKTRADKEINSPSRTHKSKVWVQEKPAKKKPEHVLTHHVQVASLSGRR